MKMTRAELESFLDAEFPQIRPMRLQIEHWDGATMRVTIPISEQHLRRVRILCDNQKLCVSLRLRMLMLPNMPIPTHV
jgi:hypothetical protein